MLTIRKPADMIAGILLLAVSLAVMAICRNYNLGTASRMGPGFFPLMLGGLLAALSIIIILRSFFGNAEAMESVSPKLLRATVLVLGGALVFGLLIRSAGMVPAVVIMVLLGSLGMRGYGIKAAMATAAVLAAGSVLVFVVMLGLPIQPFGPLFKM